MIARRVLSNNPHPARKFLMSALANRPFVKMNGLGNAIIVLDLRGGDTHVRSQDVRAIAATPGLAFDQMMVLENPRRASTAAFVRIFNQDGSEAGACGNGMRCVAFVLLQPGNARFARVETGMGVLECTRTGALAFSVTMGVPRLRWDEIPLAEPFFDTRGIELQIGPIDAPVLHTPSVVNMGNPHAIFWVKDVNSYDLARFGPMLENHPVFPQRANISLAHVAARDHINLRVWERGAGLTLACGSAACAAVVAAVRKDLTGRHVRVTLPGGDLSIHWREKDDQVIMTGPVEWEFEGRFAPEIFAGIAA